MENQVNQVKRLCAKCGAELTPGSAFCTSCGTPVPKQAEPQPEPKATAFCTNCGGKYTVGTKFCPNCGNAVGQNATSASVPSVSVDDDARKEQVYLGAVAMLTATQINDADLQKAIANLKAISDYKDAAEKVVALENRLREYLDAKELARKEFLYNKAMAALTAPAATDVQIKEAVEIFKSLNGFKDATQNVSVAETRLQQLYRDKAASAEAAKIRKAQSKKRRKRILIFALISFLIVAICVAGIVVINIPFTISYELNGGVVSGENPTTYNMLSDSVELVNPVKTGYTFIGWEGTKLGSPSDSVTIKKFSFGNREYEAIWEANQYTVELNVNGGVINGVDSAEPYKITVQYDSQYELPVPTRVGYEFEGWYDGNTLVTSGTWKKLNDLSLTAKWTAKEFTVEFDGITEKDSVTVTFDHNYSSVVNRVTVYDGSTLPYPTVPTRTGYVFTGWYTDKACTKKYDFTGKITQDMRLYAGWVEMSIAYAYGEYQINPSDYTSSSDYYSISTRYTSSNSKKHIYLVAQESGTHYIYYKNSSSSSSYRYYLQIYNLTKGTTIRSNSYISSTSYSNTSFNCSAGDVIVISIYRYSTSSSSYYSNAYFYFKGFNDVTSSAVAEVDGFVYNQYGDYTENVTFDQTITLPTPKRDGYRFLGWYYGNTPVSSGVWSIDADTSNVVLTPKWEEIIYYDVTFEDSMPAAGTVTVTFNYNYSGLSNSTVKLKDGEVLSLPTIPTRSGYVFTGWYTDSACTTRYNFNGSIANDMTLYAGWRDMSRPYVYNESQINPAEYTSSSDYYSVSTYGTSSSYKQHIYLTAQESGTHYIYYRNSSSSSSYRYYLEIYNLTKGTTIRSNSYVSSTGYSNTSFNCSAGDVIVISVYRYSTSYSSYYSTAYFYFVGFSNATSTATAECPTLDDLMYFEGMRLYSIKIGYGEEYTLPNVTRPGYTFAGWYNGNTQVPSSGVWNIAGNVVLTPQWK